MEVLEGMGYFVGASLVGHLKSEIVAMAPTAVTVGVLTCKKYGVVFLT